VRSRQKEIKQAVRLGVRKFRATEVQGDVATVLIERLQIIKAAAEFVVRDVTPEELSAAIIETFGEIDAEWKALEPIARFCADRLTNRPEEANWIS
jgi:hypothetical protein